MKYKALLLGDYSQAPYHPLKNIDEQLRNILNDSFEIYATEDFSILSGALEGFELIISYADRWNSTLSDSETGSLVSFVAKGGGLLVIHNGICISNRHELKSITAASFTRHPEATMLSFEMNNEHPISKGISNFEIHEEPYQYDFCNHIEKSVFLSYSYDEKQWPSGWNLNFGEGKIVCLHPGHNIEAFKEPSYKILINRSALWCINKLNN